MKTEEFIIHYNKKEPVEMIEENKLSYEEKEIAYSIANDKGICINRLTEWLTDEDVLASLTGKLRKNTSIVKEILILALEEKQNLKSL